MSASCRRRSVSTAPRTPLGGNGSGPRASCRSGATHSPSWESRVATVDRFAEAFPGFMLPDGGEFWRELAIYRMTHALHLRATLLAAAEAAAHSPEPAYPAFQNRLQDHARELEEGRESLRAFVRDLASCEIRVGRIVTRGVANQVLAVTRRLLALSSELTHPVPEADLPAAIGPGGTVELEGVLQPDGSLRLLSREDTGSAEEPGQEP